MANNYMQGCESWDITTDEANYISGMLEHPQDWLDLPDDQKDDEDYHALFFNVLTRELPETLRTGDREHELIIYGDENIDVGQVSLFLEGFLKAMRPDGVMTFEWAEWCSKDRPGEFGGGAFAVYGDGRPIKVMGTKSWCYDMEKRK